MRQTHQQESTAAKLELESALENSRIQVSLAFTWPSHWYCWSPPLTLSHPLAPSLVVDQIPDNTRCRSDSWLQLAIDS